MTGLHCTKTNSGRQQAHLRIDLVRYASDRNGVRGIQPIGILDLSRKANDFVLLHQAGGQAVNASPAECKLAGALTVFLGNIHRVFFLERIVH